MCFVGLGYPTLVPTAIALKEVEGARCANDQVESVRDQGDDIVWIAYSELYQPRRETFIGLPILWLVDQYVRANSVARLVALNPQGKNGRLAPGSYVRYWAFKSIVQERGLVSECPVDPDLPVRVELLEVYRRSSALVSEPSDQRWTWPFPGIDLRNTAVQYRSGRATYENVDNTLVLAPFDGDLSVIRLSSWAQAVRLRSRDGTVKILLYDPASVNLPPGMRCKFVKRGDRLMYGRAGCIQFAVHHRGVKVSNPVAFVARRCGISRVDKARRER
jgi:hypothetical protein